MNFLAHARIALRQPVSPLPFYVVGSALPDLLPLAAPPRVRLRPAALIKRADATPADDALRAGVLSHLFADAAFHKTEAFAQAQAEVRMILTVAGFVEMRLRFFFLAHVLTEIALDAALLRENPSLADAFYADFDAADFDAVTRWTEAVAAVPLPRLPAVLSRFAHSRYLRHYATDAGLTEGVNRLCARARQDTFDGENLTRLEQAAGEAVQIAGRWKKAMLEETWAGTKNYPLTTSK